MREAIVIAVAAVPATKKAEHDPALALALGIASVPRNRQGVDGAIGMGHSPFGVGQGGGAEDHIDHAQNRFGVAAHRTRARSADDEAVGDDKVHCIQHTRVGRGRHHRRLMRALTGSHRSGF